MPHTTAADLELLRRHEPIVRYTLGETFFPMDVGTYLAQASLWERLPDGTQRLLAAAGELDASTLGAAVSEARGLLYLNVAAEERASDLARALLPAEKVQAVGFHRGPGRLARVGYLSRIVDALFALSLLLRGRVPGSVARQSAAWYRHLGVVPHRYYGRVAREGGWTVLQYWFFYAYNDWRSGFNGANDHEADWEQILVYLSDGPAARPEPRWVAYAQHDYHGQALRRRWDDASQLEVLDGHPVVYAGAGSHASYFLRGEYLAEQELRVANPIRAIARRFTRATRGEAASGGRLLPIAFVDYARGDGVSIGPGQEHEWHPVVLDPGQTWAFEYRGLWGVSVQDPFEGEEAPAGPVFNRDGTVRTSWADPLGFGGLDHVPPPEREVAALSERREELRVARAALEADLSSVGQQLATSGAELEALRNGAALDGGTADAVAAVEAVRLRHRQIRSDIITTDERMLAIERRLDRLEVGEPDPPIAQGTRIARPMGADTLAVGRLLELWAAVSIGLLLILLVGTLVVAPQLGILAALLLIGAFIFIESLLRGTIIPLVTATSVLLATVAAIILIVTFWLPILVAAAFVAGVFVIWQNVRELIR